MTSARYHSLVDRFDQQKGESPVDGSYSANNDDQQEWEFLGLAVEVIQLHAVAGQVRRTRNQFKQEPREPEQGYSGSDESPVTGRVIKWRIPTLLQIAAIL